MGLALDVGYVLHIKRRQQTAADAAAMAGAIELARGKADLVTAAAQADSALNGFDEADPDVTVVVNCPPSSGPRAPADASTTCVQSGFVEVFVTENLPTYFMRAVQVEETTVQSRAVAGLIPSNADGCVIALNRTMEGALTVPGSSQLNTTCGVMVNSIDEQAIKQSGDACINATEIGVTGGAQSYGNNCMNPDPIPATPPTYDPLAWLPEPDVSSSATQATNLVIEGNPYVVHTLSPGRYLGGILIQGGCDETVNPPVCLTVNFQPGLYFIDGGGLRIQGKTISNGIGVTFYNTLTASASSTHVWGPINIGGNATVTFKAPASGPYQGVLFFNDRNAPYLFGNDEQRHVIRGTSDSHLEGALYFPSVNVDYTGESTVASPWTMLIADSITVRGDTQVENGFLGSYSGLPPTRKATLME